MNFEQTLNSLETFGYSPDIYTLFEHGDDENYRKSVSFMSDFIKRSIADSDVTPLLEQDDGFESIKFTLRNFQRAFVLTNFDEVKFAIMNAYILLSKNFIKASCNIDPEISEMVEFLSVLINYHYSIVDAIYILRELTQEARGFMNFKPPAFEISQHYLQSIKDRIDGKR